jgi:predicted HTH domain antitoxin
MANQGLKAWVKQEVLQLYANGTVTLLKMAEILSISVWEAIDLLQEHHIPIQMGRREQ